MEALFRLTSKAARPDLVLQWLDDPGLRANYMSIRDSNFEGVSKRADCVCDSS